MEIMAIPVHLVDLPTTTTTTMAVIAHSVAVIQMETVELVSDLVAVLVKTPSVVVSVTMAEILPAVLHNLNR